MSISFICLNGHRNADKRANSFWQFLHFFSTELLVLLLCRQTDKEFRLTWPSFVRVEIYYRYRLSINRKYRLPNRESSIAKWLERRPLDPGVMSSNPGLNIFLIKDYFFLFPCLSFFLNFEVKHRGNLYWKYDNTGFAMEKKPSFFYFFKIANAPHKGTIRHIVWLHLSFCKLSIQDTMLLSR